MFDFEKLVVYHKSKEFYSRVSLLIKNQKGTMDRAMQNQLRRAALSILLNIAEGTGRSTNADKRNFYVVSRGSVYECVALADILMCEEIIDEKLHHDWYLHLEELSKMLHAMIKSLA